ncbi:HhH-GPD family base excision DNA repair protein [Phlyctema vagabunda]|uniref:HhH-GPD family base excision DNA repair protein n=1 Tax=Phlyctema vagabunda TaxID=108571 RepID=A0ABR4PY07_9HELO
MTRKRAVNYRETTPEPESSSEESVQRDPNSKKERKKRVKLNREDLSRANSSNLKTESPGEKATKILKYDYSTTASSPYPDWAHPSPSEVEVVFNLLEKKHGKIEISRTKPSLMLEIEGCNDEEPALIDTMVRARLSAGTNDMNASRAFMGILSKFGRRKPGNGLGIVDWNAVRLAPLEDLYEAIKTGGMGNVKSRSIKAILDMVYEENIDRQKRGIIAKDVTGIDLLSIEHTRVLSKDEVFENFLKFPGIGPKTAACIISICMQHNSFAVDTHVYRICTWLGWVPPKTDRDGMFAHLETKIPDHLKFDLHYLMIRHGRSCQRCRGNANAAGEGWQEADCPLEQLVRRHRKQKKI